MIPVARKAIAEVPDLIKNSGKHSTVDADGGAGQKQCIRAGTLDRRPNLRNRKPAEGCERMLEQAQALFPYGPDEKAGPELPCILEFGDEATLHLVMVLKVLHLAGGRRGARRTGIQHRTVDGLRQQGLINPEALANRLSQSLANPQIEVCGEGLVQAGMAGKRRAERSDTPGVFDETAKRVLADVGGSISGKRCETCRFGAVDDRIRHATTDVWTTGNLDLMFNGGLDQNPQQILILQERASGDHRPCNLDFIKRQHRNQCRRCPFCVRQTFRQRQTDIPLGLPGDDHENVAQNR